MAFLTKYYIELTSCVEWKREMYQFQNKRDSLIFTFIAFLIVIVGHSNARD